MIYKIGQEHRNNKILILKKLFNLQKLQYLIKYKRNKIIKIMKKFMNQHSKKKVKSR